MPLKKVLTSVRTLWSSRDDDSEPRVFTDHFDRSALCLPRNILSVIFYSFIWNARLIDASLASFLEFQSFLG